MITKITTGLAVLAVSAGASQGVDNFSGNLQLLGPGQEDGLTMPSNALAGARKKTQDTFQTTQSLGEVYKFTLLGVEAQADADGVEGWYAWGGYMQTFTEQYALDRGYSATQCSEVGEWTFSATVNNRNAGEIHFATAKIAYRGAVQTSYLSNPVVFTDKTISMKWKVVSNSKGIDGYMKILGTVIKSKPVTSGELLTDQIVYQAGTTPKIAWLITRGDYGGSAEEEHQTNNGHGNNADGVDSSNPGQGGGGPNADGADSDSTVDDEAGGGGAYPSGGYGGGGYGNGGGYYGGGGYGVGGRSGSGRGRSGYYYGGW